MALVNWTERHGDSFRNTHVMVTGGAGFIGSHLTEALIDLGASVVVVDDLSGGDVGNFASYRDRAGDRLRFVEGSILDRELLAEHVPGCRFIFHQAAIGSVPRSVEMPRLYSDVNITGTLNVLEAAREAKVDRVLFAASSSAYGDTPTLPKVETMPQLPRSPYAATKAADEALMRAYACSYGLDTVSLRYFNIFGPRQNANSAYAAVIAAFAKSLLAGEPPVIFGDGEQSRDFTFVDNAVHANLLAARRAAPIAGEVLNVACGHRITVNQLAADMARMLSHTEMRFEHTDERAGDVRHSLADLTKTGQTLGYEPQVDFEQGLACTIRWYKKTLSRS